MPVPHRSPHFKSSIQIWMTLVLFSIASAKIFNGVYPVFFTKTPMTVAPIARMHPTIMRHTGTTHDPDQQCLRAKKILGWMFFVEIGESGEKFHFSKSIDMLYRFLYPL